MKHISACFSKDLIKICQKSHTYERWGEALHQFLQSPLKEHVFLGSFEQGKLILIVDCPLWASELRMKLPELRDYFRIQLQCYQLKFIQVKIEPGLMR